MNNDPDIAKSMMNFAGGALAFTATAWMIVNRKLQKARTVAARNRIIGNTFGFVSAGLNLLGCVACFMFGIPNIGFWFFMLGFLFTTANYLRTPAPPTRIETFIIMLSGCLLMLIFVARFLGMMEGFTFDDAI